MFVCRPPINNRRFDCHEIVGGLETLASIDVTTDSRRLLILVLPRRPSKRCDTRALDLLDFVTSCDVSTQRRAKRLRQLAPVKRKCFCVSATSHFGVD